MTRMFIYTPGNAVPEIREVELDTAPGFSQLSALIRPVLNGGDLERVAVLFDPDGDHVGKGEPCDMFVDENGRAFGMPFNAAATAIYHANSIRRQPRMPQSERDCLPPIVGVAVVFDRRVWF